MRNNCPEETIVTTGGPDDQVTGKFKEAAYLIELSRSCQSGHVREESSLLVCLVMGFCSCYCCCSL